jgi:hypothetical protein
MDATSQAGYPFVGVVFCSCYHCGSSAEPERTTADTASARGTTRGTAFGRETTGRRQSWWWTAPGWG